MNVALLDYINTLSAGRDSSHSPQERLAYTQRLAEAARIAAALDSGPPSVLNALVAAETRAHGYLWFEGAHGKAAVAAFTRFADSRHS